MKKIILTVFALFALAVSATAQTKASQKVSKNAIGIRFGDNEGPAIAASYQRRVFTKNRIELDLGIKSSSHEDAVKLAAIFQWVFPIDNGFHWYAGAGGGLGHYQYHYKNNYYYEPYYAPDRSDDGIFAFVAGDIGIEYDFPSVPLQLSFDIRPEIGSESDNNHTINADTDIGFAVRYRF